MEYIFGKRMYDGKETEFVKTVSDDAYSNFPDGRFMTYVFDNGTVVITHTFRILWKYREERDLQGKYCSWYYIDNHTREQDNLRPVNETLVAHTQELQEQSDAIDDIIIELLR